MHRMMVWVLVAGCVPTSYAYTPSSSRTFEQKAEGCEFEVLTGPPSADSEEVGILAHYNGDLPKTIEDFKKAVAKQVCSLGGDAVIAVSTDQGRYAKGTVLHYPRRAGEQIK